ncbi:hypothetical protein B6U67_01785 [Methanosarcinales archaeon ex4484_138]|nr:MAG: hypothetical protein B6U67_01785 [Methanosarcinales archaeon ex4484_138]
MNEKSKSFDKIIEEALEGAPEYLRYTVEGIAKVTDEEWAPTRWHVEILERAWSSFTGRKQFRSD